MSDRLSIPANPSPHKPPRLLADVGATYARLCTELERGIFDNIAVLACSNYTSLVDLLQAYLAQIRGPEPRLGAVAIANPVEGDRVQMTNRDWSFSIQETQRRLGLETLLVVNNFTALAMSLPHIGAGERVQIGGGQAQRNGVIGLIGPGTGLGVSGLVPVGEHWATLATEGGHVSFAPNDERELRVLQHAWQTMPRVSAERLVSGPGLELIHQALSGGPALDSAEIVRRALQGTHPDCTETVDCFCSMLGGLAGDLALTLGATGGIYVGGGIVPRLGGLLARSPFRERFEAKGRLHAYVSRIPTYVITADHAAFAGISSLLAEHVPDGDGGPLLQRLRTALNGLSPAERRVAGFVLDHPRQALNEPIAAIARGAKVSQPTVIRFCRSLGFEGLADFKRKLGAGLTGTLPVQRTLVRRQDGTADLCAKVLDNTISAIVQLRESLNVEAVDRAIALLRGARRVEFYACGNSALVAQDAQHKLLRLGIASVVHADAALHGMGAALLAPQDVAVFVSGSSQPAEFARAADVAQARGASVIAITAGQSALARRASVCIAVEHDENGFTSLEMLSRILHLLVTDMLSVGLALRRTALADAPAARRAQPAPGVLISHIG